MAQKDFGLRVPVLQLTFPMPHERQRTDHQGIVDISRLGCPYGDGCFAHARCQRNQRLGMAVEKIHNLTLLRSGIRWYIYVSDDGRRWEQPGVQKSLQSA